MIAVRQRTAQFVLLIILLGAFLARESRMAPLGEVDGVFLDWLSGNAPRQVSPVPLTLIEINDSSIGEEHPLPWNPLDYALFLQASAQFRPAVTAVEPVLSWGQAAGAQGRQTGADPYLRSLHDYLTKTPKVLVGAKLGHLDDPQFLPAMQPVPAFRNVKGDRSMLDEYALVAEMPMEDLRLSPSLGFVNLPEDRVLRSVPVLFRYRGEVVPSFALQAAILALELTPDDVRVEIGSHIDLGGKRRIPVDAKGNMAADYAVPFSRFGYDDLILAAEQKEQGAAPAADLSAMAGGVAMLARTDAGSRSARLPLGRKGSGGEALAAGIATILSGSYPIRAPWYGDAAIILLAAVAGPMVAGLRRGNALLALTTAFAVYLFVALTLFSLANFWLPLVVPGGLTAFLLLWRFVVCDPAEEPGSGRWEPGR